MRVIVWLLFLSIGALLIAPLFGAHGLDPFFDWIYDSSELARRALVEIRAPRAALGYLVGAGLGVAGMSYQIIFQNRLATPFTLGISSAAAFGASVAILLESRFDFFFFGATEFSAFIAALTATFLIYVIAVAMRGASSETILLAGVAISFIFASLNIFIHHLAAPERLYEMTRWLMGSVATYRYEDFLAAAIFSSMIVGVALFYRRELDLLRAGELIAATRGAEMGRFRLIALCFISVALAGLVSICGPIGFIGMMAPHIMRLIVGSATLTLTLASALFGGLSLLLCDTIARTVVAPAQIPVGAVTALFGGPFFLWLLLKSRSGF